MKPIKIVVADPIFLPEEYRKQLEALGDLEVYDTTPTSQREFAERVKDAELVIVGRYGFNADAFLSAPHLKMISLWIIWIKCLKYAFELSDWSLNVSKSIVHILYYNSQFVS